MNLPWTAHYDPWFKPSLPYPEQTLYEGLTQAAGRWPDFPALSFMGSHIDYQALVQQVDQASDCLQALGMKKGEVVAICLPNTPHAVIIFYAINRLGGICNMIHPLTPAEELSHYIRTTDSDYLIILDAMLARHTEMLEQSRIRKTIVCSIMDFLNVGLKVGFFLTKGRKIKSVPRRDFYIKWSRFMQLSDKPAAYKRQSGSHDCAVYLHSGGTTGSPKTIMLSSFNFNVLAIQGPQIIGCPVDDTFDPTGLSMVTILPLFHGFGLCMGMHTMLVNGMRSILVPQFTPEVLADVIVKERPAYIAAVPTLFEGILKNGKLQNADLSCLKAVFCGGDSLPKDLKRRFDTFIQERGAMCTLREGYGLTETVTVCAVNPMLDARADSVGLPLADVLMKVVEPGSMLEVQPGQDGEFCIHAPTIMLGYLNDPEATSETVRLHDDGLRWVHTGDFGYMDPDGYFHFKQRIKRILKVSGIPVFPSQIEDVIAAVPGVRMVCAIGIPHPYKMQVVKVFIVPDASEPDEATLKERIISQCEKSLIQYAVPKEVEFRSDLPRTKVGKIDFVSLERIEIEKHNQAAEKADITA
ncbi:MAG: class I adenylate-forming enzyme family protein [Bacillota bacterium]|nr:class I adenylate-forming enzyme family protein [Bacillota bacterium]